MKKIFYQYNGCCLLSLVQVRSLSSYLDMEGYDRPPFTSIQLRSFHNQLDERLEQEKETFNRVMVKDYMYCIYLVLPFQHFVVFFRYA